MSEASAFRETLPRLPGQPAIQITHHVDGRSELDLHDKEGVSIPREICRTVHPP
jgi:hypothetical protein